MWGTVRGPSKPTPFLHFPIEDGPFPFVSSHLLPLAHRGRPKHAYPLSGLTLISQSSWVSFFVSTISLISLDSGDKVTEVPTSQRENPEGPTSPANIRALQCRNGTG